MEEVAFSLADILHRSDFLRTAEGNYREYLCRYLAHFEGNNSKKAFTINKRIFYVIAPTENNE